MLIKVCGLNNQENIMALCELNIQFIGFIFYKKSPRYFNNALNFDEARIIPKKIKKVGVFVNEPIYNIINSIARYDLDFVQVHGEENYSYCKELSAYTKIIKTISVKDKNSFSNAHQFSDVCDYFLFDTATSIYGGSGNAFNWDLLNEITIHKPFFMSGGISLDNFNETKKISNPNLIGIDVNSKFEITPGLKDLKKINLLIKQNYANTLN